MPEIVFNPRAVGKQPYLPLPKAERSGFGLSLSGGGFRAALFHLGAMRRLNELEVLPKITTISSVSGGSVFSAFLTAKLTFPVRDFVADWEARVAAPFRTFCNQ